MANYRVSINPDTDFAEGQVVRLLIDGANTNGDPMDQLASWFKAAEATLIPGKDYLVTINPDSDFAEGLVAYLQVEASNDKGDPMDQQRFWFRVYEMPVPMGKDYRVTINPDADFSLSQIVKLQLEANNDLGDVMDVFACWFKALEPVIGPGKNYRVSIDPEADFASGHIAYLQVEGDNLYGNPMDAYLSWFRMVEFYSGYRVVINPDADFEELTRVDLEIAAINAALLSMLKAFWFETEHLDVVVSILPGYPDVGIISKKPGFDTALIMWEVNKKIGTYQLEVGGNGKGTGIIPGTAFGSQNVQGDLPGVLEPIDTLIKGADLEVASPDSGEKRINIWVTDQWGYSNSYEE